MRPASPEDRQRIVDLYKGGMTRPAIARETGWSEGTVHNIIKAAGVQGAGRVTGIRTDPATEARVMTLYEQGVPWREIQRVTGRTEHTVSAIIKRNGSDLDRRKSLTPGDWQEIISLYKGGMDAPEIGRRFGCHSSMAYYVLERSGIDRREQVACDNAGYFDEIDAPEKAYWLGFIGADGCVTGFNRGYPRLAIKLARRDRDHLLILHGALSANRPVRDHAEMSKGQIRPYSTLTVNSPALVEGLLRHGITARKSATLQPWNGPEHLMPHYWRGIVDGDGYIHINPKGVFTGLAGSEFVARGYAAWVNEHFGTHVSARPTPGQVWTVQIGGTLALKRFPYRQSKPVALLAALYDDAPVALARKKALADLAVHGKPLQASMF